MKIRLVPAPLRLELERAHLLALHLGRGKDDGVLHVARVSSGKLNNVREAIARQARTILGANGITLGYPVTRYANNLESVLTYEGASKVRALALGQQITGRPAYR